MSRSLSFRRMALALVALGVLGLAFPAPAEEQVPFKGLANGAITGVEPAEDGLHLTVAATGLATHLGQFTRDESVVLHADGTLDGTLIFTAADGDQLFAEAHGGFISASTAVGTYTFTGGTGRFADASGHADFVGVTTDGIHIALTFEGTIEF